MDSECPEWYIAYEQVDLSLHILHMFDGTFSLDMAQLLFVAYMRDCTQIFHFMGSERNWDNDFIVTISLQMRGLTHFRLNKLFNTIYLYIGIAQFKI